jgi:hypothetical protein
VSLAELYQCFKSSCVGLPDEPTEDCVKALLMDTRFIVPGQPDRYLFGTVPYGYTVKGTLKPK